MTQPASPFGVTIPMAVNQFGEWDIDPTGRTVSGRDVLSQRLINRQTTPQGTCIDAPNDCLDVRDLLSDGLTVSGIKRLPALLSTELLKDQGVLGCNVQVSYNAATSTLTIVEQIQSAFGPFSLTLSVTSANVSVLVSAITNAGAR